MPSGPFPPNQVGAYALFGLDVGQCVAHSACGTL